MGDDDDGTVCNDVGNLYFIKKKMNSSSTITLQEKLSKCRFYFTSPTSVNRSKVMLTSLKDIKKKFNQDSIRIIREVILY
jgi:hypothetical protein